jgi:predicted nucleic acid-binding protein
MDDHLRRDAATLKVLFRLSVSDSLGLALARRLGCPFLTADHHELDAIASSGAADTSFIR